MGESVGEQADRLETENAMLKLQLATVRSVLLGWVDHVETGGELEDILVTGESLLLKTKKVLKAIT